MCASQDLNAFLVAAGVFPCPSKVDKSTCLESSGACVEAEGARRAKSLRSCSLLPAMGLLNHPKATGSSGHIVSEDQVDSPAELDLVVMVLLLSAGCMQ